MFFLKYIAMVLVAPWKHIDPKNTYGKATDKMNWGINNISLYEVYIFFLKKKEKLAINGYIIVFRI